MSRTSFCYCDRCGRLEQEHLLQQFTVEFNKRYLGDLATALSDVRTPDLCPACAEDWAVEFFNKIKTWSTTKIKRG
jgi:hypothetical protein